MKGLELIEYVLNTKGEYYWCLDMKGIFLESKLYKNKREALYALVSNNVYWDSISINIDKLNDIHNQCLSINAWGIE